MLFGEYAVIEGATALLCATPQQAKANYFPLSQLASFADKDTQLAKLIDKSIEDHSGLPIIYAVQTYQWGWSTFSSSDEGLIHLGGKALPFVEEALNQTNAPAGLYFIDTREFGINIDDVWVKMGIGSSGAATASLLDLIRQIKEPSSDQLHDPYQRFLLTRNIHRKVQGGLGSGADVAISTFGGLLRFSLSSNPLLNDPKLSPLTTHTKLPRTFGIWRHGKSTSTIQSLKQVQAWKQYNLSQYQNHMNAIAEAADHAYQQLYLGQVSWVECIEKGGKAIRDFGQAVNLPLWTKLHDEWSEQLAPFSAQIKPTGAGGDDLTLFAAPNEDVEQKCFELLKRYAEKKGQQLNIFRLL